MIGAGRIGERRARVAAAHGATPVVVVADLDPDRAARLAAAVGATAASSDWRAVVARPNVALVVAATTHRDLPVIALAALAAGKHVLVEKPFARSAVEAAPVVELAHQRGLVLKVGYNHRHHPAIQEAHRRLTAGEIGPLLFARCRYGHGGRPGYDREWRADPDLAGGGELLDQGVHVLDLFRWFFGDFADVAGHVATYFWDMAPLEDNAFALLRTAAGQAAQLHVSWTQWKNLFSFELVGRDGYLVVDGLGGSYGPETLRVGRRRPEGGAPDEQALSFPSEDLSWGAEWDEFVSAVRERRQPLASGDDGFATLRLVDAIYESARAGRSVSLPT